MTCREEVLECVHAILEASGETEFSTPQVLLCMVRRRSRYQATTIRTHISSKMCANAPKNHGVRTNGFVRVAHGRYRLAGSEDAG